MTPDTHPDPSPFECISMVKHPLAREAGRDTGGPAADCDTSAAAVDSVAAVYGAGRSKNKERCRVQPSTVGPSDACGPQRACAQRLAGRARLLSATLGLLIVLPLLPAGPAMAATRPIITAPNDAEQGQAISFSVEPGRAGSCWLITRDPGGRARGRRVPGGGGYGIDARVRKTASAGRWSVVLRCGGRRSTTRRVFVSGSGSATSDRLLEQVRVFRFDDTPVNRLSRRKQNGRGGPRVDEVVNDGLGGDAGGRAEGSIAWALARQGDTSYYFWCLKFVANAFGVNAAGYATAQAAANALGVRDRAAGPGAAPRGALVFFRYVSEGVSYGHVGISLGDGRMVHAVRTVRVEALGPWAGSYLGWAYPPASWPGRFIAATPPPAPTPAPAPAPAPTTPSPAPTPPPAPPRKVITVDNRVTNGMGMREDSTPVRLQTKPWIFCGSRGCNINGTERSTGGTYDAAVCQMQGERTTNGNDHDAVDDANPARFESTRYYGVRLGDGTFGVVSETWIRSADRGGLGLPAC